jgi:hypothetical protein
MQETHVADDVISSENKSTQCNLSDVENAILKDTVFQLENRLKGTEGALNRAIEKYTYSILRKKLINESDESNSICTLTVTCILVFGAYLIPWFI